MSDSTPGSPPAGWYPDPAGGPNRRWWDGSRWTERIENPVGTVAPTLPAPSPSATPSTSLGTSPHTWAMWVVALTPILLIVSVLQIDFDGYFRRLIALVSASQNPGAMSSVNTFALLGPSFLVAEALNFVVLVAFIVFAALDYRILKRRGIERPFHWAWSFFTLLNPGWLVFLIGRTIVAHRRTGRSASAPMWTSIGLMLVLLIVTLVKFFGAISVLAPELQQLQQLSN